MWKNTIVAPIPKKGNTEYVTNIRPISLIHLGGKLLEKVVNEKLMKYLEDNKLLSDNQLGFRKGHSTTEAIYYLFEKMNKSINTSEYCLNVFIDFSKAFDSIMHEILISKLSSFGISEATINLFRSYLSNRQQCVILNNHFSDSLPVLYGVPQGSVLGPTLFIMYVNDIFNILFNSSLKLYADDAVLTLSHKDPHFLLSRMSNDLDLFTKWAKTNKLPLMKPTQIICVLLLNLCLRN